MTDTTTTNTAAADTATALPSILDIAHKVATTDGDVSKADAIRLASFILDRREQIEAHYQHLRMAQPPATHITDEPRRLVPRGNTERLAASDPAKQIEGSTTEAPAADTAEHAS